MIRCSDIQALGVVDVQFHQVGVLLIVPVSLSLCFSFSFEDDRLSLQKSLPLPWLVVVLHARMLIVRSFEVDHCRDGMNHA